VYGATLLLDNPLSRWTRTRGRFEVNIASGTVAVEKAEILGIRTVLIAAYDEDVPDPSQACSYGPAVEVLREVASRAATPALF